MLRKVAVACLYNEAKRNWSGEIFTGSKLSRYSSMYGNVLPKALVVYRTKRPENLITTVVVACRQFSDKGTFEYVCDETLEAFSDYFEELVEGCGHLKSADVTYSDGVLTVNFGSPYGTYVINRQTPNEQIWLSSPLSGPKRYDFISGQWIYKHDGVPLHKLLDTEISQIVKQTVDFSKCLPNVNVK
ncbi:frataxin homolog, mitochondrial isoform X1 [Schistocerca piceifrons]|uniref:frataxin homolog, mitochondrial isoform X1 n=1 Tax=Schistocerca piceifrons TaxID=274613 RepID=UPI001F5FAE83|nr:frataxin homolog, mitochondrial isoform X1 [Schistocerca piceifrons]